jgi:hypothetical protein
MENFKYIFENNVQNSFCYIFDELYYLINGINQLITSINRDNSIQSSPIICGIDDRVRRMISSTPSFFSRQIDPITGKRSKVSTLF